MKTTFVFVTLLVMLYAETYKMVLRSTGSRRARMSNDEPKRNYPLTKDPLYFQGPTKRLVAFLDYYDDLYLGNVTIGTPGQAMSLLMDTGSATLWVFDTTCRSISCIGVPGSGFTRRRFNTRSSSTFARQRRSIDLQYGAGRCSGPIGRDVVSFAGATIENQEFVSVTEADNSFFYMPIDGILGLGRPAIAVGGVTSPIQNILSSLDASLFTVWLDKKRSTAVKTAGLITFGAINAINCQSQINYVPLSNEKHWQFAIEGFSIGRFSQIKREEVVSDTGTSWIGAPTEIVEAVVNQTGALYDSLNKFYTISCSTMKTQPDLSFTINCVKYNIPPEEYVLDIGIGGGQCVLAFLEIPSGSMTMDWILGEAWIRTYCNIYDFGQNRIGFAKAIHSEI